jgi:hypothetical protein
MLHFQVAFKRRINFALEASIAARYRLDGPGIECRWGRDFPHPSRPASYTVGTGSSPGLKRPGRGVDYPPHLAPRSRMSSAIPLLPLWALRGLL